MVSPSSSREINGPRPPPLKIHKDSHKIQKQSAATGGHHHNQQQRHQPVIIYTHSPKVIHTQARDFMALVQKLTGIHRSPTEEEDDDDDKKPEEKPVPAQDQPSQHGPCPGSAAAADSASLGFEIPSSSSSFFSEIPLFTPSSAAAGDHFFYSPRSMYIFPPEQKAFPDF